MTEKIKDGVFTLTVTKDGKLFPVLLNKLDHSALQVLAASLTQGKVVVSKDTCLGEAVIINPVKKKKKSG